MNEAYQYLYEHAGPVVRCEAARALGIQSDALRAEMLKTPVVEYWIERLAEFAVRPQVHNADDRCLENSMHKLVSFGIRQEDDPRIRETNAFVLKYLEDNRENIHFCDSINQTIAASWLACMGHAEGIIQDILLERVDAVYGFVKDKNYDIYCSPEGYPAIAQNSRMHPLVNPALYEGNVWRLPTVHDMFAYAHLPDVLGNTPGLKHKTEAIAGYILDERYQRLYRGYGLMLVPPNRYYKMGWAVHLSRYSGAKTQGPNTGLNRSVVWEMELLSHFDTARRSRWFKENLRHLDSFAEGGLYEFPPKYLPESAGKYYVGGGHMGLGENRKNKKWRRIESTAWMIRILAGANGEGVTNR